MIRPATPRDVPVITSLIKELANYEREPDAAVATEADLHAALFGERPAVFALIAEHPDAEHADAEHADAEHADAGHADAGQVAGFALWFLNFSTWVGKHGIYLEDLYVRPEFRGFGYGKALLTELGRIAGERGYGRLEWSVLNWNTPAHGFYRSLGAEPMQDWTVWRLAGEQVTRLGPGVVEPNRGTLV